MLLTIDVGNSHTVLGAFEGEELCHMWRVQTNARITSDEARARLASLCQLDGIDPATFDGFALATVVPALRRTWGVVAERLGARFLAIDAACAEDILDTSTYASTPGADRVADAVAAVSLYGTPVVVLDLGTATNIEVVDANRRFLGGVIAPGLLTQANALSGGTALLPQVELADPGHVIGCTTAEAIQAGLVYGHVDAIDGAVRRIWEELGYDTPVVATGGFCRLIGNLSHTVTAIDPELTLHGLRILFAH